MATTSHYNKKEKQVPGFNVLLWGSKTLDNHTSSALWQTVKYNIDMIHVPHLCPITASSKTKWAAHIWLMSDSLKVTQHFVAQTFIPRAPRHVCQLKLFLHPDVREGGPDRAGEDELIENRHEGKWCWASSDSYFPHSLYIILMLDLFPWLIEGLKLNACLLVFFTLSSEKGL